MRLLIREIRRTGAQGFEHSDTVFEGDTASIGRATDQTIQLADRQLPLAHSELRDAGRSLSIRAVGDQHFFVNGGRTTAARIGVDDLVEIGGYVLVVREAPDDFDFALDYEQVRDSGAEVEFGSEFVQSLEGTRLSRRFWSWIAFVGVLLAVLGVPAAGLVDRDVATTLRSLPVPDDSLWSSGPLHEAHTFMGGDCSACHVAPFARVDDEQCVACHQAVTHHVDAGRWQLPDLEGERCAGCHKEHNEPSVLSRRDQGLCADCHRDLTASAGPGSELLNVSDFGEDHPEFRVSLLRPSGMGSATTWAVERATLGAPGLVETSNLIFPHDVHMNPDGIGGPTGEVVMVCSDCHRAELSGAYMEPISMERHCADCHLLTFDQNDLSRQLPHGEPDLIVRLLEEYYAREALFGAAAPDDRPLRAGRRPGSVPPMTAREREIGLERTSREAFDTAEAIFERTTCKICHVVTRDDASNRASPWQVAPVRVAPVWLPKGWFDHEAHVAEDCARCHAAEVSSSAADINLPVIDSCRDCHGGEHAKNRLASECVECHVFHLPTEGLMRPDVRGAQLLESRSDLDRMRDDWREQLVPPRPD